jgi:hypothetical protein
VFRLLYAVLAVGSYGKKIYDTSVSESASKQGYTEPVAVPVEDASLLGDAQVVLRFAAFQEYRRIMSTSKAGQLLTQHRQGLDTFLLRHVVWLEGASLDAWLSAFATAASSWYVHCFIK